jgi:hypothetical protein
VRDLSIAAGTVGTDDLAITLGFATIFLATAAPAGKPAGAPLPATKEATR